MEKEKQMDTCLEQREIVQHEVIEKKGGIRTLPFIIANETFEKVSSFGLVANMILYLKNEYHLSNATGAYVLFVWSAIANFLPIIGAFLSDSYFGRFRVIALGSFCSLTGMILLFLTTIIPQATPPDCNFKDVCVSPKSGQLAILFSSFVLMAIGAGGVRPCSLAFGADQLDKPDNPKNERILQSFFNWYYASVGVSLVVSVTVIVYIQDKVGWVVGFSIPVGLMFVATLLFLAGSSLYINVKPNKSLFTGFSQVIVVAWKNKHLALPQKDSHALYYHKGSEIIAPTETLRFLNKACIIKNQENDLDSNGFPIKEWQICSVKQVEELKAIIKILPIWSSGIMLSVTISQHAFPVLQASTMNRKLLPNFKIPPGSFSIFSVLTLTIWVAIYDRVLVRLIKKITKNPRGLSLKQRMGIGLVLSCIATTLSAIVESKRRDLAFKQGFEDNPHGVVNMSAMWLVPQHCFSGLAEAFNAIGQIEFYYSQLPKTIASVAVALFSVSMALGNLVGILIVGIVNDMSKKGGNTSWVSNNINKGHYDYYYWILAILCVTNFCYYLICIWAYGPCEDKKVCDEGEPLKEEEMVEAK